MDIYVDEQKQRYRTRISGWMSGNVGHVIIAQVT